MPADPTFRHAVERRSAVLLVFLSRLPRALPGVLVLGLVAAGLLLPPPAGGIVLLFDVLVLIWLVYLSWPRLPVQGRGVRLVVVAMLAAYAVVRLR